MVRTVTLFALFVVFGAQSSFADAIHVSSGTMTESASGVGDFTMTTDQFSLSGTTTSSSSVLWGCETCDSGMKFKLNGWWEFEGEVESGGTTYDATGRFRLNSRTAEIPDFGDLESGQFTQAFHFVGRVNATDGSAPALRLLGRGLATISFFRDEGGTILPSLIRYDFDAAAQTPEPATLALVASGLALVARRRSRSSRP